MKSSIAFAALLAGASAMPYVKRQSNYSNGTASIPNPAVWENLRGKIKHVVYLMEENHSFDNIAGYWDFNPDIDNLYVHTLWSSNPSRMLMTCQAQHRVLQPLHQPQLDRLRRTSPDLCCSVRDRSPSHGPRPQLRRHLVRDLPEVATGQERHSQHARVHRAPIRQVLSHPW